jgi:hypothetical protein
VTEKEEDRVEGERKNKQKIDILPDRHSEEEADNKIKKRV